MHFLSVISVMSKNFISTGQIGLILNNHVYKDWDILLLGFIFLWKASTYCERKVNAMQKTLHKREQVPF